MELPPDPKPWGMWGKGKNKKFDTCKNTMSPLRSEAIEIMTWIFSPT